MVFRTGCFTILVLQSLLHVLFHAISGIPGVRAACECGYTTPIGNTTTPYLFTDLIESDFLHLSNITLDTDWRRQNFTVAATQARGVYGMNFTIGNINANPIAAAADFTDPGIYGAEAGLTLTVSPGPPANGYVPSAELDSTRLDLFYGSYRAAMKMSDVPGTCAAFFWYFSDSQEIDMEFLSSAYDYENNSFPVNLVLQSEQSVRAGYNTAASGNYIVAYLPFNPTTDFHEYRIDFVSNAVIFYADGLPIGTINGSAIPTSPGHMIVTHWSNGNPLWSFGPPETEANLTVSYVKAYFNSTDPMRQKQFDMNCQDPEETDAICAIPELNTALGTSTAGVIVQDPSKFFFSHLEGATPDQIVYKEKNAGGKDVVLGSFLLLVALGGFAVVTL